MSALFNASPRKKRGPSSDGETVTTPKKLRAASLASPSKPITSRSATPSLPTYLTRIQTIHTSLQHALSVALATSAVSPSVDTGRVPNVLNHLSLSTAMGFTVNCDMNDVRRLCWLWEWNGNDLPSPAFSKPKTALDDDDNPFLVANTPSDWTRGAMGFIITPTTHFIRTEGKRMPAYGIGIEVEMDLTTGKSGGMAAVARWTAEGESRKKQLEAKLRAWVKINAVEPVPLVPLADLPALPSTTKLSSLTKLFTKSASTSPTKSPNAHNTHPVSAKRTPKEFAVPFPVTPQTPSVSPTKPTTLELPNPRTPQTPSRQMGPDAATMPQTPTTSRRAALYERIRQKSLTSTPSKGAQANDTGSISKDAMRKLGQEELKRRCLLGRLDEVAATIWALFSSPGQTSSTPLSVARKRRTMQTQEVIRAVVSSATIPISSSDAQESITLLMALCPFFLRPLVIAGEDWVEMPASNPASLVTPPSPRRKEDSEKEVLNRSPKTVKIERGGLRDVRERIRRELALND